MRTARLLVASMLAVTALKVVAQEGPSVRVIVRAEGKGAAAVLQAADLRVEYGGHGTPVTSLQPLMRPGGTEGLNVEVVLLIDNGLRSSFGNQLRDVRQFVRSTVSPQVAVGVAYMQNGRAVFAAPVSHDVEVVVKAVRLPSGPAGISASPYFCLQDLVKHWPTSSGAARVVLMITNGIDLYNGSTSPLNQSSPYVDAAVKDAQRAAVPVYSIFFGNQPLNSQLGSFSGQSYLQEVAQGTGGKSFNVGTLNPPSLAPYFTDFKEALTQSYLLRFPGDGSKLERLKVSGPEDTKLRVQTEAQP